MKELLLGNINEMMNSPLSFYGSIASIVIGVVLILAGLYLKKKDNQWWIIVVLLGAVSAIVNGIQLLF